MTAIALDTNLLLLFVVGRAIGKVVGRRLKAFTDDDLIVLGKCLDRCERLIVTSNVWTEVSNIWDYGLESAYRAAISDALVEIISQTVEIVRASRAIIGDPEFARLGITDCVWLAILDADMTLLTDDLALCQIALSRGHKAVNFTELRNFDR